MIAVVQRVSHSSVSINHQIKSKIGEGLLVLLGIAQADEQEDINWLVKKIIHLRIFDDDRGVMNRSLLDINGELLVVSQFTLHASTKKGNRPSYIKAAKPDRAIPLYESFIETANNQLTSEVKSGEFGANMKVESANEGPVTIIIDTQRKQ